MNVNPKRRRKGRLLDLPAPAAPAPSAPQPERRRLAYTLEEAAQEIRVSERTVRRLYKSGKLVAKRIGGRVVVLDSDLQQFMQDLPSA